MDTVFKTVHFLSTGKHGKLRVQDNCAHRILRDASSLTICASLWGLPSVSPTFCSLSFFCFLSVGAVLSGLARGRIILFILVKGCVVYIQIAYRFAHARHGSSGRAGRRQQQARFTRSGRVWMS